jgi:HSP20 family protein
MMMAEQQKTKQTGSTQGSSQESTAVAQQQPRTGMMRQSRMPSMPSILAVTPYDFLATSPFQLMRRMMEDMDRMFEAFNPSAASGPVTPEIWAPAIEVAERDGSIVVKAELPGVRKEDVKVELTPDGLLIEGERKEEREERQKGMVRSECRYGQFSRLIPLPEGANMEQAKAQFTDGVLEITIPIAGEKQQRREIPIEAGGSQTSRAAA